MVVLYFIIWILVRYESLFVFRYMVQFFYFYLFFFSLKPRSPSTGRWVPGYSRWVWHFGRSGTLNHILRPVTDARMAFRRSLKWWEGQNREFPAVKTDFNCVSGRRCNASPEHLILNGRLRTSGRLWLRCMAKHHLAPGILRNLHVSARSQKFYTSLLTGDHNQECVTVP